MNPHGDLSPPDPKSGTYSNSAILAFFSVTFLFAPGLILRGWLSDYHFAINPEVMGLRVPFPFPVTDIVAFKELPISLAIRYVFRSPNGLIGLPFHPRLVTASIVINEPGFPIRPGHEFYSFG